MSSGRILVVDDEPQILRALKTNLTAAGYEVETAATAEEALALAAANPPDALILDLVLPDRSGIDVTRDLRTWSSVPIVLLPLMTVPILVFSIVLSITSVALALSVLMHKGRGGGLSDLFGGGISSSMGGTSVAERNLDRLTIIIGVIWLAAIVALGLLYKLGG